MYHKLFESDIDILHTYLFVTNRNYWSSGLRSNPSKHHEYAGYEFESRLRVVVFLCVFFSCCFFFFFFYYNFFPRKTNPQTQPAVRKITKIQTPIMRATNCIKFMII